MTLILLTGSWNKQNCTEAIIITHHFDISVILLNRVHLYYLILKATQIQMYRPSSVLTFIWATWENLFLPYANNKGAGQPAHACSLISTFVIRCLDSIIPLVSISEISSLFIASVAAQAGLCLLGSQTKKTGFLMTWLILSRLYLISIWNMSSDTHYCI